nr:UDP-GalNAc:beta-1,3-N-acetylgalactosaminyltransferase 1 isoform X5 [Saimiri boliviensis boliviensis]
MQGDPEDPESVPSGRAGLRAQDARPRPQRVVCARSAVRAPAGRVRVCARRERRTPSRFRAGCALCSGECLRLGGDCFVGKTTIKEGIAKSCVFFCFQSNSQQI